MKLSLCMIVRDEERDLPGCLESVQGLVDEIVVVDTGSRDRSPEIAKGFGAKVFPFKWANDFAAARNESLKHATGDYVIWLDADDRVPETEREKFLRWKQALSAEDKKAYWFIVESPKEEEFLRERCYQLRAFPRLPGVKFIRRVHETVLESLKALGIPMQYRDITILHEGYARRSDMRRKASRNLKLLLSALAEAPQDPTIHWHLSMTYDVLGKKEKSLQHAETLLGLLPQRDLRGEELQWKVAAMVHLGNLSADLEDEGRAEEVLREALRLDPDSVLARFFLAKVLMKRCAYREAIAVLEPLRGKEPEVSQVPFPQRAVAFYTHLWLGTCYEAVGDRERALQEYAAASEINPRWSDREAEIGEHHLRQGHTDRALPFLERALTEDPFNPSLLCNLGLAYRRKGDLKKAEDFFRKALKFDPEHFDTLVNLGHLLLLQGRLEEAVPLFERAASIRRGLDLEAALLFIKVLTGRIERSLPHTEKVMEILGEKGPRTLDTLSDYSSLLYELGQRLRERKRSYEAHLLFLASEHLRRQEALLPS